MKKSTIEDYQILLIRQCKRNKPNINIMRRIYAKSRALSLSYVTDRYVLHALLEIIEQFGLMKHSLSEFIFDLDPERDAWFRGKTRTFHEALFSSCISTIALTKPSDAFPRYPLPAYFKNKYNEF